MPSNKRFTDIKTNIGNEVGDTSSSFATRLGVYINNRYMDILQRLKNADAFELFNSITATTTAAVNTYAMPFDFGKIIYALDQSNNKSLDVITEKEWVDRYGDNITQQSTPAAVILLADSDVRVQPASATKITGVSTSSSDTTQSIFVRGISGSAEVYETFSLNGTTTAQSSNTYDYILQLGKSSATTGVVNITYTTGGSAACVISPQSTEQRYKRIGFHYVPAGTYDIKVRYEREIMPMVNDNDFPVLDIADGIELGAKSDAWRTKRQFANSTDFESKYEFWLDQYITQRLSRQMIQFAVTPQRRNDSY